MSPAVLGNPLHEFINPGSRAFLIFGKDGSGLFLQRPGVRAGVTPLTQQKDVQRAADYDEQNQDDEDLPAQRVELGLQHVEIGWNVGWIFVFHNSIISVQVSQQELVRPSESRTL